MAEKTYTMVHAWNQVVSKPTDPVYLTERRPRGSQVKLDENSEDASRLLAAGSIVVKGEEPDDLKAEMRASGFDQPGQPAEDDQPTPGPNPQRLAASSGATQTSSAAEPAGEGRKARLHTSTPN
jgi:hypothetical protein